MATPITVTLVQFEAHSGGALCENSYRIWYTTFGANATQGDAYTFCEACRTAGIPGLATYGFFTKMNNAQKGTFVKWILDQIVARLPDAYPRKAACIAANTQIQDCIDNPSPAKRSALSTLAQSIKLDVDNEDEFILGSAFKRVAFQVGANAVDETMVTALRRCARRAGQKLGGLDPIAVEGAILTKMEEIAGIKDP